MEVPRWIYTRAADFSVRTKLGMEAGLAGCFVGAAPLLASPADRSEFCLDWCTGNAPSPQGTDRLCLAVLVLTAVAPREGRALGF